jgi:putative transposase
MPRANRYILPGYVYHLTHRCHNREFLLQCAVDRAEYCMQMVRAAKRYRISLFTFCVTCNHVHLLGMCDRHNGISRFIQRLDGEFGQKYNLRNGRTGAFWGDRFHATMIDGGDHMWNCLRYIDLNMVRAGVVNHPSKWHWCGYHELTGANESYGALDIDRLVRLLGLSNRQDLAVIHQQRIDETIRSRQIAREAIWTESIAVGSKEYVNSIAAQQSKRKRLYIAKADEASWYLRETHGNYGRMQLEISPPLTDAGSS